MAAKRRYALDKMKILSEELTSLPKLLKLCLIIAAVGVGLSCMSIWLQFHNVNMLKRAETRHRKFINRITYSGMIGNVNQMGIGSRTALGADENGPSEFNQCRYRQKTEWMYYDADSKDGDKTTIAVDFSASEGHTISTASCVSNDANSKYLQQSAGGYNRIYQCICKGHTEDEAKEHIIGYEKLTCTANYWECPTK